MKFAVTGGAGQLGTLVLRRLIDHPSVDEVVCLDLTPPSLVSDKLRFVQADVRDADLDRHLDGVDGLFHFAFIVTSKVEPGLYEDVNVRGSQNVFTRGVAAGVRRFVYASSIAAYGVVDGHPEPIVEDTPRVHQPSFPYSACKFEVEKFLDAFEKEHDGLIIGRLRPAILVGTHFQNPGARILGRLLDRGMIAETSAAEPPLPLVWDEDVADAAMTIMFEKKHGPFILAADEQLDAAGIAKAANLKLVRPPAWLLRGLSLVSPLLERIGIGEAVDPSWQQEGSVKMVLSSRHAVETLPWKRRCPTCADVVRHYLIAAPQKTDAAIEKFLEKRRHSDPKLREIEGPIHIALTGKGGGDFCANIAEGRVTIAPGIPRPPISAVTLSVDLFRDLMARSATWSAVAATDAVRCDGAPSASRVLSALFER